MKKLALALVATTAFTAAQANIGTGFYIGAHTGYDSANATVSVKAGGGLDIANNHAGRGNANVGLFAGYGMVNGCFYYGGEIGYTFASTKMRSQFATQALGTLDGNAELKRSGYFNAAVRLGYLFSQNTMGYVRLGVNWGKWNLRATEDFTVPGTYNVYSANKNSAAFAPGVGIETALNRNVSLRAEWTYEFGRNLSAKSPTAAATDVVSAKSIRNSSFKLGIAYRF